MNSFLRQYTNLYGILNDNIVFYGDCLEIVYSLYEACENVCTTGHRSSNCLLYFIVVIFHYRFIFSNIALFFVEIFYLCAIAVPNMLSYQENALVIHHVISLNKNLIINLIKVCQ